MFREIRNYLVKQLKKLKTPSEQIRYLDKVATNADYDKLATKLAKQIVAKQSSLNAKTWRQAAAKTMQGRRLYKLLSKELGPEFDKLIEKTAEQIRTLPYNISTKIVKHVADLTTKGMRSDDIAKEINKQIFSYSTASARLIARTQVAKTLASITEVRSQRLGVSCYVWWTLGGPRVRDSHRIMNDVICLWSQPPSPEALNKQENKGYYHPGGIYNCRCYAEPILDLDQVTWPHKVCYNGVIERMTRKKFEETIYSAPQT